jgi:hypothetical protein
MVKSSLTYRYLVPLVPSALFALTLMTQACDRRGLTGASLAIIVLLPGLNATAIAAQTYWRTVYTTETSNDFLRAHRPDRLIFLWDHPLARIMDRRTLEELAGYSLRRAGVDVPVHAVVVPRHVDANAVLRAAASGGGATCRDLAVRFHRTDRRPCSPADI